ncbi:MAG: transporter substrate-binding domain-containing protein [Desulfobacter sp.]|nr:MAG: transporter substrate-binding domain-containing protein [Desulfobacter sp.]
MELSSLKDPVSEVSERILTQAYKRIGITLKIRKFPAERALLASNAGSTDGEVNRIRGIDKKYANLIMIPTPVNYFEGVVFTKNLPFTLNGWDSLRPYRIVMRIGSKFAEKNTQDMTTIKVPTYGMAFHLLDINRADICLASRLTGLLQIKKLHLMGVKAMEQPLVKSQLYHYVHKKNKNIIPKINASLIKMHQEGLIEKIRAQYIEAITTIGGAVKS